MSDEIQPSRVVGGWKLFDQAKRLIPCGTGTNSKAPRIRDVEPAYIVRGKGCRVWDIDGNEYIDFRNGLGPITLGYDFEPVKQAIAEQLDGGMLFSHPHPLEFDLAKELVELLPAAECVRYLKTGGEAMAAAVKLARAFTGREMVISSGYQGWLLTVHNQKGVPQAVSQLHHQYDYGDVDQVRRLLQQYEGQVAAVSLSGSYPRMRENDLFPCQLRELTEQHNVLLIIDEIVTGYRLRVGGFHEYYGFMPDLAVFSKGMANGMPLSAYVGRRDVMQMAEQGAVVSSTFSGETLSLAAALAVSRIYKQNPVIDHLWRMGRRLSEGMRRIFTDRSIPIDILGLPPCSMLVGNTESTKTNAAVMQALFRGLYRRGISMFPVLYVNYSHTEDDIDETLRRVDTVCATLLSEAEQHAVDESSHGGGIGIDAFRAFSSRI